MKNIYDPSSLVERPPAAITGGPSWREWLSRISAGSDAAAGDQEQGPAPVVEEVPPGLAAGLGGADPAWAFAGEADAEEAIQAVAAYCRDHCPVEHRCVEERCRTYRLEQRAVEFLESGEGEFGVLPIQTIGLG